MADAELQYDGDDLQLDGGEELADAQAVRTGCPSGCLQRVCNAMATRN